MINKILSFENNNTEKIKMNHVKTLACDGIIGVDKLNRFKLLKDDPFIKECGIDVRNPENISRFLSNFNFKITQMLRDVNFKTFKKFLKKKNLKSIVINIDNRVVNVEGNQKEPVKGYNLGNKDSNCYNIIMAFCDELKAYITGFMRSGNTYTSNGAAEMIMEIIANLKEEVENIIFRMDSGYFSEEIIEVIEEAEYQKQAMLVDMKPDKWSKTRSFVVVRELKPNR